MRTPPPQSDLLHSLRVLQPKQERQFGRCSCTSIHGSNNHNKRSRKKEKKKVCVSYASIVEGKNNKGSDSPRLQPCWLGVFLGHRSALRPSLSSALINTSLPKASWIGQGKLVSWGWEPPCDPGPPQAGAAAARGKARLVPHRRELCPGVPGRHRHRPRPAPHGPCPTQHGEDEVLRRVDLQGSLVVVLPLIVLGEFLDEFI